MGPIAHYQSVLVDRAGAVGTITFNRPAARNALDLTMREELVTALDDLEADETVRAVILTGAGGHFSAGGDVKTMVARQTAAEGRARVEMLSPPAPARALALRSAVTRPASTGIRASGARARRKGGTFARNNARVGRLAFPLARAPGVAPVSIGPRSAWRREPGLSGGQFWKRRSVVDHDSAPSAPRGWPLRGGCGSVPAWIATSC